VIKLQIRSINQHKF